jgi:hypothetical protein
VVHGWVQVDSCCAFWQLALARALLPSPLEEAEVVPARPPGPSIRSRGDTSVI